MKGSQRNIEMVDQIEYAWDGIPESWQLEWLEVLFRLQGITILLLAPDLVLAKLKLI